MMTKDRSLVLSNGDAYTVLELIRMAASLKGLELIEGASKTCSKYIAIYPLDQKMLDYLSNHNFEMRSDGGFLSLCDKSTGGRWNYSNREGDHDNLELKLAVGFKIDMMRRGIIFVPHAYGTGGWTSEESHQRRMFRLLVASTPQITSSIALEIASSEKDFVLSWTKMSLGGIRPISNLFEEFASISVQDLAHSKLSPFNPAPYSQNFKHQDQLFIIEPAQPKVFDAWRSQLKNYRDSLHG